MRKQTDTHFLSGRSKPGIDIGEDGSKLFYHRSTTVIDERGFFVHLLFVKGEEAVVYGVFAAQKCVAAVESLGITDKRREISGIVLRNNGIKKLATPFALPINKILVDRRDQNKRDAADMIRETAVSLAIEREGLALTATILQKEVEVLPIIGGVATTQRHLRLTMTDGFGIRASEVAAGETQVVDCVEQIGFPFAVVANKTVDSATEAKLCRGKVLEVIESETVKLHDGANLVIEGLNRTELFGVKRIECLKESVI